MLFVCFYYVDYASDFYYFLLSIVFRFGSFLLFQHFELSLSNFIVSILIFSKCRHLKLSVSLRGLLSRHSRFSCAVFSFSSREHFLISSLTNSSFSNELFHLHEFASFLGLFVGNFKFYCIVVREYTRVISIFFYCKDLFCVLGCLF